MGRASFGGSSDYSSLFQSVYGESTGTGSGNPDIAEANKLQYQFDSGQINAQQYAAGLEAIAAPYANGVNDQKYYQYMGDAAQAITRTATIQKQAEAQAAADQAAADSDAQSQWQNGVMSNDEWLAYVGQRAASAGDVKEQAKWQGYLLKFTEQIADDNAEYAYSMGGSISDLISYYQTKAASKVDDSADTHKDKLRLNDLIDTRASQNVTEGVQKIIDQITAGKATYADLLKFEKQALASARPGSAIAKQLESEIVKVTQTIAQNKSDGILAKADYDFQTGHLTGASYAKLIEREAQQYKNSDPKKYYQFLESAHEYRTKEPGLIGSAAAGRAAAGKAAADAKERNEALRRNAYFLIDAYDAGKKVVEGPNGKVTLTPELIRKLDERVIDSYNSDFARGDKTAAVKAEKYLNNNVLAHNTIPVIEREFRLAVARNQQLDDLEGASGLNADGKFVPQGAADPLDAAGTYARWLKADEVALLKQTNIVKPYVPSSSLSQGAGASPGSVTPRTISQRAPDPAYVAQRTAVNAALRVANSLTNAPGALEAAAASLATAFGGPDKVPDYVMRQFDAMAQNAENAVGKTTGARALVSNIDGKLQWVDTAPRSLDSYGPNGKVAGSALYPRMEQAGVDPSKPGSTKIVDVVVDVRGVPTHVKAVAVLAGSDLSVWRVGAKGLPKDIEEELGGEVPAGTILTSATLKKLDELRPGWRNAAGDKAAGSIVYKGLSDEGAYYRVTLRGGTDENGKNLPDQTWTQDPGTNQWTRGENLQLKNVTRDPSGDGTVLVTDSGPQIDFMPDSGFAVPAQTRNLPGTQKLINSDPTFDNLVLRGRDLNGNLVDSPVNDVATSFWNPADPNLHWVKDSRQDPFDLGAESRKQAAAIQRRNNIMNEDPDAMTQAKGIVNRPNENVFADIKDFASSMGIRFAGVPSPSAAPYAAPSSLTRGAGAPTSLPGPTPNAYTGFVPTAFNPGSYSGPKVPPVVLPTVKVNAATGFVIPGLPTTSKTPYVAPSSLTRGAGAPTVTPKVAPPKPYVPPTSTRKVAL